jgi:hypothetical protein
MPTQAEFEAAMRAIRSIRTKGTTHTRLSLQPKSRET